MRKLALSDEILLSCLLYTSSVPHLPRHPDSIYLTDEVAKDERGNLIGYFAAVTAMDAGIGKIMEKLEDMGIAEDTLCLLYTSRCV